MSVAAAKRQMRRARWWASLYDAWRTAPPKADQIVRWESIDGRWVSIGLGDGERAGYGIVRSSSGACEWVDSYEGALALARQWRTL
jgi:hypothetical protein